MTRSPQRANSIAEAGFSPVIADITDPASLANLPDVSTVLLSVGYDRNSGKPLRDVFVGGIANVLDALPGTVSRLIYISSTGVYGQDNGEWVDENSACQPRRDGGRACLDAERIIAQHALGRRATILRLAGIYGPGRIPRRSQIEKGEPIASPSQGYLNLIHVDDAAAIVLAAGTLDPPHRFVVSDGTPVPRVDYYREVASRLQSPPPVFTAPDPAAHATERAGTDKRVDNRRMLAALQVTLRYPSYREGLAAILAQ